MDAGEEGEKYWKYGKWLTCTICENSSSEKTYQVLPCFHFVCDKAECVSTLKNFCQDPAKLTILCPPCEKQYEVKDLVVADEETNLFRLLTAGKCCESKCTTICTACNVKYCPTCHKNHEAFFRSINYFKNTHNAVEFRKRIFKCTSCESFKIMELTGPKESCDNEECGLLEDTLTECNNFPESFLTEVNKDILSLRLALMKFVNRRDDLTASLQQMERTYNEHKLSFSREFGITLPPSSELKSGQMYKIKSKLESVNSSKLHKRVFPFLSFLTDYLETNVYPLIVSYRRKYKVTLNAMLKEISSIMEDEPNSSTATIDEPLQVTVVEPENTRSSLNNNYGQSSTFDPLLEDHNGSRETNGQLTNLLYPEVDATGLNSSNASSAINKLPKKPKISVRSLQDLLQKDFLLNSEYNEGPCSSKSLIRGVTKDRSGNDMINDSMEPSSSSTMIQNKKGKGTIRNKRNAGGKEVPYFPDKAIEVKRRRVMPRRSKSVTTSIIIDSNSESEESLPHLLCTPPKKLKKAASANKKKKAEPCAKLEENWEELEAHHYTKLQNWEKYFDSYKDKLGQELCCAFCHGGGDLIMCDGSGDQKCPKSFHMGYTSGSYKKDEQQCCHMPQLLVTPSEKEKWQCFFCMDKNKLNDDSFLKKAKKIYFVPDENSIFYSNTKEYFVACKFISDLYKPKESLLVRSYLENVFKEKKLDEMGTLNKIRARLMKLTHIYRAGIPPYGSIRQILEDLNQMIKNANKIYGGKSFSKDYQHFRKFKEVYDLALKDYQETFPLYFPSSSRKPSV